MSTAPDKSPLEAFLEQFGTADQSDLAGSLSTYLREYPGDVEDIARAYAALEAAKDVSPLTGLARLEDDRLGPYLLEKELGRGGQGVVYLAEDTRLGRKVALKILTGLGSRSEHMLTRFQREAAVASRLDDPGICTVYESGVESGVPYIAMRYVEGESLAQKLVTPSQNALTTCLDLERESDSVPHEAEAIDSAASSKRTKSQVAHVVALFEQIARSLHAAHEAGVIHRDIKPGNIMITPQGRPVIMDFGLARTDDQSQQTLTQSGDLFGTPAYMSPEQVMGHHAAIDRRTDIWSLGASLFQCVTLRRPFAAPTRHALYHAIQFDEPADPRRITPAVSRDLKVVIETTLQKDPNRRYQTALDLAEDLRRVCSGEPIRVSPPSPWVRALSWIRRNRTIAAAGMIVIGVLSAGLIVALVLLESERAARAGEATAQAASKESRKREVEANSRRNEALAEREEALEKETEAITDARRALDARDLETKAKEAAFEARDRALKDLERAFAARGTAIAEAEAAATARDRALAERNSALTARDAAIVREEQALEQAKKEVRARLEILDEIKTMEQQLLRATDATLVKQLLASYESIRDRHALSPFANEWVKKARGIAERRQAHEKAWESAASATGEGSLLAREALRMLVDDLERLEEPIRIVNRSILQAEAVRKVSLDDARAAWTACVADLSTSGLLTSPQFGLVPLGKDKKTGLWNFWHVASGSRPGWKGKQQGGTLERQSDSGIVLVLLPGGRTWMGAQRKQGERNYDPGARREEKPVREITLSPFFISKFELTHEQARVISVAALSANDRGTKSEEADLPMVISRGSGARLLDRVGLILPTEAQWEYAARGGKRTPWWVGWDRSTHRAHIHAKDGLVIGQRRANPFGLHDVIGNVWEWCRDDWAEYSVDPRPGDGLRTGSSGTGVCRGGRFARSSERLKAPTDASASFLPSREQLGLRPARAVER